LAEDNLLGNSPFILGVSGHRDLNPVDEQRLRDAVTNFVQQLQRHLPSTRLQIIVGMAEGADLLVAQTALELGVHVQAVLPMSLEDYAADFDADNLALLQRLLARPDVHSVELSPPVHLLDEHGVVDDSKRDAMYENLTETLIRRSNLLLALWDGNPSKLPGGTADTVLRYLGARTDANPGQTSITFIDAGGEMDATERLVYWAPAARISQALSAQAGLPCFLRGVGDNTLEMQQAMPGELAHQLAALNHYNREYQELQAAGSLRQTDSLLTTIPADVPLSGNMRLEEIDAQYRKADTLAVHYQLRSNRLFILFGVMTFTLGLAYLVYEKISESRLVLVVYLAILLTSSGLYYVLRGRHWFAKHLIYRGIAETMRVKFYLRLAGIDHRVDAAEVFALSGVDRFQGFSWINYVLKGVESFDIHATTPIEEGMRRSRAVEQAWIDAQLGYFTARVKRLDTSSRRFNLLRNAVFMFVLLVVVCLFAFGEWLDVDRLGIGVSLKTLLTFCMGFLAVTLGAWELHQGKMATRELLWQYRNQRNHFARARRQLAGIASLAKRTEVLVRLGRDSLMESYLWTIHRYHREHEPPAGT
jgi:hypothetical protein